MGLLDKKVAVITGSGRGIGAAIATLFAKEGASVVINDIDEKPCIETRDAIRKEGGKAEACVANIVKPEDCDRLMKTAAEKFGGLDILVNNAGTCRDTVIHKMTDQQWNFIIDVCLRGTFNCMRASAPYMREAAKKEKEQGITRHRKIVNISSIAGTTGSAGQMNYAAAKAGIVGMTKSIAKEWAQFYVNANAIAPGFVDTRLTQAKQEGSEVGIPEEQRGMYMNPIVMPWGPAEPIEIAYACLFLASRMSDYITGQTLTVAGALMGTY